GVLSLPRVPRAFEWARCEQLEPVAASRSPFVPADSDTGDRDTTEGERRELRLSTGDVCRLDPSRAKAAPIIRITSETRHETPTRARTLRRPEGTGGVATNSGA